MKNLIIECENLLVLQKLLPAYEGKIDVMPIDPPYNTDISYIGYSDKQADWIGFMRERMKPAYRLLSDKGVMFIHIDENELVNLTMLCREIFGAENIMTMVWKKTNILFDQNRREKPLESGVRRTHEYVLLCFKDRKNTFLNPIRQPYRTEEGGAEVEKPLETVLDFMGTTSSAKDELFELLGRREVFSTPKPVKLIKEFIRSASNEQSIILDFFAGSGTTGHAVMDLNREDGGKRKFILITNNEADICKRVTVPRIKAAIAKNAYHEEIEYYQFEDEKLVKSESVKI